MVAEPNHQKKFRSFLDNPFLKSPLSFLLIVGNFAPSAVVLRDEGLPREAFCKEAWSLEQAPALHPEANRRERVERNPPACR